MTCPVPSSPADAPEPAELAALNRSVVFYDGGCPFCQNSVRWLWRGDAHGRLAFAPLQGTTAACVLAGTAWRAQLTTMVVVTARGTPHQQSHVKAAALAEALAVLPAPWRWGAWLLRRLPRQWADAVYDWVVRHRYRLWPRPACALPTEKERQLLEDQERWLP